MTTLERLSQQTQADRLKMLHQLTNDNSEYSFFNMHDTDLAEYLDFNNYTVLIRPDADADGNTKCESCGNTILADARCPHCYVLSERLSTAAKKDVRVIAIRADSLIGNDSYSFIDECLSATNIVEELDAANIESPVDAIRHFITAQGYQYERGLDARAGNDNDPELLLFNEWEKKRHAHLLTLKNNTFGTAPLHGQLSE